MGTTVCDDDPGEEGVEETDVDARRVTAPMIAYAGLFSRFTASAGVTMGNLPAIAIAIIGPEADTTSPFASKMSWVASWVAKQNKLKLKQLN